jgi:hypothetical protein
MAYDPAQTPLNIDTSGRNLIAKALLDQKPEMGKTYVGGGYVINDPAYGGAPHFYRDYGYQTPAFAFGNDPNDIDYNDLIQGRVTITGGPYLFPDRNVPFPAPNQSAGSPNTQTFMGQYPAAGTPYGNETAGTPAQVGSEVPLPGGGTGPMTQEMYDLYNQPLSQEMIDAYNHALGITGSVPQPAGSPGGPGGPPLTPIGLTAADAPSTGDQFQGATNMNSQTSADQGSPYVPSNGQQAPMGSIGGQFDYDVGGSNLLPNSGLTAADTGIPGNAGDSYPLESPGYGTPPQGGPDYPLESPGYGPPPPDSPDYPLESPGYGTPPAAPAGGGFPYIPTYGNPFQGANVNSQTPADMGVPYIPSSPDNPFVAAGSVPPSGGGPYVPSSNNPFVAAFNNPFADPSASSGGNPYLQQSEGAQNKQRPQGGLYSGFV